MHMQRHSCRCESLSRTYSCKCQAYQTVTSHVDVIAACMLQAEGYARKHLDMSRYNKLKKDIERYRRYLYSDTIADEVKSKPA